jgi:hypothetical protein
MADSSKILTALAKGKYLTNKVRCGHDRESEPKHSSMLENCSSLTENPACNISLSVLEEIIYKNKFLSLIASSYSFHFFNKYKLYKISVVLCLSSQFSQPLLSNASFAYFV